MLDLKGHLEGLRRQLRALKFNQPVNYQGMAHGEPSAFVDLYRKLLCDFNAELTSKLVDQGFGLLGTTDFRFMEVVYRILRDLLNMRPAITLTQFNSKGFAERKLEMATSIACQIAFLINPTRRTRRVARPVNGQRSLRKASSAICEAPCRIELVRSVKQSASQTLSDARSFRSGRVPRNIVVTRSATTDGVLASQNANGSDNSQGSETHSSQPKVDNCPPDECHDHMCQEKLAWQPPTFVHVNSFSFPTWAEESHNQAAIGRRFGFQMTQSKGKKWGNPTGVSSKFPNASQSNQLQERHPQRHDGWSALTAYAKHNNQYLPLNSNPRPCALSPQNVVSSKPAMPRDRASATMTRAHTPTGRNKKTSRSPTPVVCTRVNSDINFQTGNDQAEEVGHNAMQEILTTLSQLNGKVDSLISRLGTLETRLSNPEIGHTEGQMALHDAFERQNDVSQHVTHQETISPQEAGYWESVSTSRSESTGLFVPIQPPVLISSATAATTDQKLVRSEASELQRVASFSNTSPYTPPLTAAKSRWPKCAMDERQTPDDVRNPRHFSAAVSVEQPSISSCTSSAMLPSPPKVSSHSFQNLSKTVVSQVETDRSTPRIGTETHPPPSIWSVPRFGDTLKSPLGDLSKRSVWPSLPSAVRGKELGARPASLPPKTTELPPDPSYGPCPAKFDHRPVLSSKPTPPEVTSSGVLYRQKLFGRTHSSSFSTTSNSGACDSLLSKSNVNSLEIDGTVTAEPYHSQVNRITAMLAETKGLLETQRSNLVNGTA